MTRWRRSNSEACHFAEAQLMQDLARLGIRGRVGLLRLKGGEPRQHGAGNAGVEPQKLDGDDDAVASECGRKPGYAGIGIEAFRRRGQQHGEIGNRSIDEAARHRARCRKPDAVAAQRGVRTTGETKVAEKGDGRGGTACRAR